MPPGFYFPDMVMDAHMQVGQNNFVMMGMEVMYQPRLAASILRTVNADQATRITVDAAGYRDRRTATLVGIARRAAEQATGTGRSVGPRRCVQSRAR